MSNVPKLRFKEFSGEWEEKRLGDIGKIITGSTPSTIVPEYYGGNKLFVSPSDIQANRYINNTKTTLTELGFNQGRKVKKYSVCFVCIGSTIGKVAQLIEESITNQQINCITANSDNFNDFIYSLLEFKASKVKLLAGEQALPQINKTHFSNLKFYLPSKPEQEKIASFLTSVDTKIEQLTKKEVLLQEYKKGVMNRIFNQEIRFKDDDGSEFPEWKETRLNKLTKIYDGTHSTPNYVEKGIPFYSVEHITANQFENTKYITEEVFEKENKRVRLERNDILMTKIGDIGTSRLIDWDVNASFYVSLALIKANSSFCSSYLNQYIKSNYFQKQLHSKTLHVAFPKKINLGEIGECIVLFPNIQEQTKIANFLSSIDKKIEVTTKELNSTKEFKKALLQQMFV